LQEIKNQLRVTTTADDDAFRAFIAGIRHKTESYLGKTLITATWEYKLDKFEDIICLPMAPIQSITSISYIDNAGAAQSFTDYQFDASGRLAPGYGFEWPSTRAQFDAVTITYIAGFTHAGKVPPDVKTAMLLWIGALDIGREDTIIGAGVLAMELPDGAKALLSPHKNWLL
jgi:uncharacterized phiE125 gp8 family phage protein